MHVSRDRARNFLAYGFGISIAVHALVLPFAHAERTFAQEPPPPDLYVTHMPTPPPTPRPTPTPQPTAPSTQPPREKPHPPAPQPHALRINPPHATAHRSGAAEAPNAHASGDPGDAPNAPASAAPAAAPAADTPVPPPAATATPRSTPTPLSCARPNVAATTVRALEPETPAMAQQQGISGTVNVVVSLDTASRVVAARIQSSPSAVLNPAALAAARGSQFRTEVKNCEPVAADYVFSVDFTSQ